MKKRIITFIILGAIIILIILIGSLKKSYAYGISKKISGTSGQYTLNYIDIESNSIIPFNDAAKYFGVPKYEYMNKDNKTIYFYQGKEISEAEYKKGSSIEAADNRANMYGKSAYRVHNTNEFKHALDDIYTNFKIGEFHIEFSHYEDIDLEEIHKYYKTHYGVLNYNQNYYTYQIKGPLEPARFGLEMNIIKQDEELVINSKNIRISGNERMVLEEFTNGLLPFLNQGKSDYDKILAAYTYLYNTASYITDNGFVDDLISSNTSAYDALINQRTTCIGYSIAFSYLMDKLGVESYIVDNITEVNPTSKTFSSVHTWNIVKLNDVFYKIDLTGNVFLGRVSKNELYDNTKNLASSSYNGNRNINIDYQSINAIRENAKQISTTTTTKVKGTSTTKTYSYELPYNPGHGTTYPNEEYKTTTETTYIITTDKEGNTIEIPITTEHNETTKTTISPIVPNKKKKFNFNIVLIPLLVILLILLAILRLKSLPKSKSEKWFTFLFWVKI